MKVQNGINKILVANRGEISIRVFRAASELNIKTVAIYTHEDRFSLHRYKADQAFQVGADDDPLKPYLNIAGIIEVATEHNVDAIHPGYGFLSENPDFARACRDVGIIWIGPSPEVMESLGDKLSSKTIAKSVNVPIVEASAEATNDKNTVGAFADEIGFPVMIKAATGGGGRGMRVVRKKSEFEQAFSEASREAKTAFGDDRVFVEKYIDNPKHIEVQILGDSHGNIVHLFERDCSVQRRFQKVVEVAPSLNLDQKTKDKLYKYALDICKSVGYENAGTVEFLVDNKENIYFIEVNTRIQVEHTITEVITGIDLVRAQILIAGGENILDELLSIGKQEDITSRGFAIQCRITTENPQNGFKPDYGRLVAYRSAGGFGIRLDAGNAYAGANISPFFDSMLVKVTAWGHRIEDCADRLHRALREFRIRGVNSNIAFLLLILKDENFRNGNITVNYIQNHPELLISPPWKDRGTRILRYLANVIVNGNGDVKKIDENIVLRTPRVPITTKEFSAVGTKDILNEKGRDGLMQWVHDQKKILYTDTTFRDAHQSLLATRMRTFDLENVASSFSKSHGNDLFSMEIWGGATFDVCMRFLKESPWKRLSKLRSAMPNVLLQMLLRGSNGVGYKAYPDNVIHAFIIESAKTGIDVFRVFDSLNWIEGMRMSIEIINKETNAIAEACVCYTGDVLAKGNNRFGLSYYTDIAKRLEDSGAHMIAIKDMAGLLKPYAAELLVSGLKEAVDLPIHLHTHDTSSIQSTTYLKAIESGVDIVDVAISSMSGLTSQPNFNSIVAMMQGHERENNIDLKSLNKYSDYWENVRTYYYPFETELKAGTAEVYEHEIPGGQYSNLRPQARGLGLEDQFDTIKKNYKAVNDLLGGIVKVTPSSKVVGDMAMFLTSNKYTVEDILEKGDKIDFPDSFKSLMRGDLGQWSSKWPHDLQKIVLKQEKPYTSRPNTKLKEVSLETEFKKFKTTHEGLNSYEDFLSSLLYPQVFEQYYNHWLTYGDVSNIPTKAFFFGIKKREEITVSIAKGKNIIIEYMNLNEPDEKGNKLVLFRINGDVRGITVKDKELGNKVKEAIKAVRPNEIGSPLQGSLSKILVKEGDRVKQNDQLFTIEAMKMESTITAPLGGKVTKIYLAEKTLVSQDDMVLEIEEE
ncbi:MAG: pyruvate carboxylase [Saprospiraceae bacterium]